MKKFIRLLIILSTISIVSCTKINTSLTSPYCDPNMEGGECGRIIGNYFFDNYDDFSVFYNQFAPKNNIKFLVPQSVNTDYEFLYHTEAVGVLVYEYRSGRYDVDCFGAHMYLKLSNDDLEINGECYYVQDLKSDFVNNLSYKCIKLLNDKYEYTISTSDNYCVFKSEINLNNEILNIDEICNEVLIEFEKGVF